MKTRVDPKTGIEYFEVLVRLPKTDVLTLCAHLNIDPESHGELTRLIRKIVTLKIHKVAKGK